LALGLVVGAVAWWAVGPPGRLAAQVSCRNVAVRSPVPGEMLVGTVPILGSAQIDGFNFYKVEWAPSDEPDAWRAVSEIRPEPVINGLLDQWATGSLADGLYRLKLTVVELTGTEVCWVTVEDLVVGNASATASPTASETPTATPTPTLPATEAVEEPTAAPTTEPPTATVRAEGEAAAAAATATPPAVAVETGTTANDTALGIGTLLQAFVGGFCLIGLLAVGLMGLLALRRPS